MSGTFYYEMLDWTTDDETPNPCYNNTRCKLLITSSHNASVDEGVASDGVWKASSSPWVANSRSIGELGENFKKFVSVPRTGSFLYNNILGGAGCVGIFYSESLFGSLNRLPNSVCAIPPEEKNACSILTPQITLNHGALSLNEINNHKVTESLMLSCDKKTSVILFVNEGTDGMALNGNRTLLSNLQINGSPANKGISLVVGPAGEVVQISSILQSVGDILPGDFQASAVAIMAMP